MYITINIPDNINYWYKPVIWFIDPKDEPWSGADLLTSICNELQLDVNSYSLSAIPFGNLEDGMSVSLTKNA